jgi:hypothetical protein
MRTRRTSRSRRRVLAATLAAGFLAGACLFPPGAAMAQTALARLAAPGPWPGVSRIVAFDGAVWFVNSEPFAQFNAADIYRYDPKTRAARYERGLFSQHAGAPAVYGGRLYWPFEDPRSNAALGEYAVTDGENWQWHTMADAITLNVNAMSPCRDALIAGTGGWSGALQLSRGGAEDWREVYRLRDNSDGRRHITALGRLGERCFFGVTAWDTTGPKLFEWTGDGAAPVPGWPGGERVFAITEFKGALYALNDGPDGRALWRYDGAAIERVAFPAKGLPRDLSATDSHLLAVSSDGGGGDLWRSEDGTNWTPTQRFDGERPIDVATVGADVYVGTYRDGGAGALWGPAVATVPEPGPAGTALAPRPAAELGKAAVKTALRPLEQIFATKSDFMTLRSGLFNITLPLARTHSPAAGELLTRRAGEPMPDGAMATSTGQVYSNAQLSRWLLLYSAAINGTGRVPLSWIAAPWRAEPRASEKYFETSVIAIWAAARFGQNSAETIDTLVGRLGRTDEPAWIKGDAVASLTALTGGHFGHDFAAWRDWWREARPSWPQE